MGKPSDRCEDHRPAPATDITALEPLRGRVRAAAVEVDGHPRIIGIP
jgi:hypothetical protein